MMKIKTMQIKTTTKSPTQAYYDPASRKPTTHLVDNVTISRPRELKMPTKLFDATPTHPPYLYSFNRGVSKTPGHLINQF